MDEIIHVGFESADFSFVKEISIGKLLDVIVEHVNSFQEASEVAAMLGSLSPAGRYDGNGWSMWFSREIVVGTIH